MPPALYLASACVKTTIWVVILVLNLVAVSIIAIVLTLVLAVTSLLQLIYGAILVHRKRRGTLFKGRYAPAHNPDGNGTNVEAGAAYAPHNNASYYYAGTTTEYKPTASTSPAPAYASPHSPHSPPQPQAQYGHHPASYELDSRPQAA
ncbi:hypothetical protein F4779DRAFT_489145 [Xylariaceae sp. FL0662B]|nr:hypothetical protein F4779DRAFT_489145 [Xylariaceae sp. FL0662B]